MSGNFGFRLAKPEDATAFAEWVANNPQIDARDIQAAQSKTNPTVLYFVATKDDVPVAFAPLHCVAMLDHLAFNPESEGRDRLKALQTLIDGCTAFFVQLGIREIQTLTKEEYPVGAWALKHGFEKDDRETFRMDINKLMAPVAVEG